MIEMSIRAIVISMALGYVFQLSASPGEERVASLAKYGVKIPDPAPARDESEGLL